MVAGRRYVKNEGVPEQKNLDEREMEQRKKRR